MFFPRLSTLLPIVLLSSAIGSFAAPAATQDVVVKRQDGLVAALTSLKTATAAIVVSTNDLVAAGNLNDITGAAEANKLIAALTVGGDAVNAISALGSKRDIIAVRQDLNSVVGDLIKEIIADVSKIVVILQGLPLLGGLLIGIDAALAVVLTGVGILLQGVLQLVGTLLGNLSTVLLGLGAGLSAGLLGL